MAPPRDSYELLGNQDSMNVFDAFMPPGAAQPMHHQPAGQFRLDAADNVFFQRQLELIDPQLYENIHPTNLARTYIPTQPGLQPWARTYTFQMIDMLGEARIISNMADDLPRVDATGEEESIVVKPIGASYGWSFSEIRAASASGTNIESIRAMTARFAIEQRLDRILALGSAEHNLKGLLNLDNIPTTTPSTKSGGGTTWANGTANEISRDMFDMASATVEALNQAGGAGFNTFTMLMPLSQYNLISQERMGDANNSTIRTFVLQNSPFIEAIEPWRHCTGAGAGSTDRIVLYPRNPIVLAAVVPMEYTTMPPQSKNLMMIVNAMLTTAGVVVRYPVAVRYMDGV